MHIVNVAGPNHVGLGGDFDGVDELPSGLEDVSKYPNLIAFLLDNGFKEEYLPGLLGQNLLRVWRKAETVARNMQNPRVSVNEQIYRVKKTCMRE